MLHRTALRIARAGLACARTIAPSPRAGGVACPARSAAWIHDGSARPFSSAAAVGVAESVRDAELESEQANVLAHSYFPFGETGARGYPLCRAGFGGTPRAGNNSADASAAVKSYIRLGGNFVDLTRGFSLDMIDAFKELIRLNKISGDILLNASVSSQDLLTFISQEEDRWKHAQRRVRLASGAPPAVFVSQLLPPGVAAPQTPRELLPLLPHVFPQFMRFFLDLHELGSIDTMLFEPPLINLNPAGVPDAAFDWMGGVNNEFISEDQFVALTRAWFEVLEREVASGQIKSYGLSTARLVFRPSPVAAASSSSHTSSFHVPLKRVLQAAQESHRSIQSASPSDASSSSPSHNLTTLKFPFSLFNAHHLLYESDLLREARAHGLLVLADTPFDDVEPQHREWVRFQECTESIGVRDADKLLTHYREAMGKLTALEVAYKHLVDGLHLPAAELSALPSRIPHMSWAHLLHTHQNELYNVVTWEQLLHGRIRPSLQGPVSSLKGHREPKLAEWAKMYLKEAPVLLKTFQQAVEHSTGILNERLNAALVVACPRLASFPTLEEKTILILLSTGVDVLLTDQTDTFDIFAHTLVRLYNEHPRKHEVFASAQATTGDSTTTSAAPLPTITAVAQHYLLTPVELRAVLDLVQTRVATMLPAAVMKDPLRKKKPTVCV